MSKLLDVTGGPTGRRFPVDVAGLAVGFSHDSPEHRDDPVLGVSVGDIGGADGCLLAAEEGPGWGILLNRRIRSPGRILHTQAHEFAHYLLHRELARRTGQIRCSAGDIAAGTASVRDIEREADEFATGLLMPLNDFRRRISERETPDLARLSGIASDYGTSVTSTALRWLEMTDKRAVVVAADADFILWSRSGDPAFRSGAWLRTASGPPVEAPHGSLLAAGAQDTDGVRHGANIWFGEPSVEMCLVPDSYEFRLSVVILGDRERSFRDEDEETMAESVDTRFRNR